MLDLLEYYLFISTCILLIFSTFFSNSSYYSNYKQSLYFFHLKLSNKQFPILTFKIIKYHILDLFKTFLANKKQFYVKLKNYFIFY
jgi:hypothetical protein